MQIFRNGLVRTLDPAAPEASAIAVRDGVVVALGDDAEQFAGPDAEEIDLDGGLLLPSFGDGHAHPVLGSPELLDAPIREATSVEEVVAAVARFAGENRELPWVLGGSYDPSLTSDGIFHAAWLDTAVPDRPVALTSADHHALWVNSEALRRAGITAATPDPPAATICRDQDGAPIGTLSEWTAMELVQRHIPPRSEADYRRALLRACQLFADAGVTWVQDALAEPEDLRRLAELATSTDLPVRVNVALRAEPGRWLQQRHDFAAARAALGSRDDVTARTIKFFADGVIEAGTAALLDPYVDAPHSCGLPVWDPAELREAVCAFDADGFQVHLHAIGDAGIRNALDAIEEAERRNGPRDRRPVLAHVQLVDPVDLPRFARLGVVSVFSPLWARLDATQTVLTIPRLGPQRSARQYPMAGLAATGAVVAFGSDWPVSSLRPLDALSTAVTRQLPDGTPEGGWLPHERLPVHAALSAYTQAVAYQAFEQHRWGTISVGRRADLVLLGADLLKTPALDWPEVPVLGTWLAGRRTAAA